MRNEHSIVPRYGCPTICLAEHKGTPISSGGKKISDSFDPGLKTWAPIRIGLPGRRFGRGPAAAFGGCRCERATELAKRPYRFVGPFW